MCTYLLIFLYWYVLISNIPTICIYWWWVFDPATTLLVDLYH